MINLAQRGTYFSNNLLANYRHNKFTTSFTCFIVGLALTTSVMTNPAHAETNNMRGGTSAAVHLNFRIVITDAASRKEVLGEVTSRIRQFLIDELAPIENWGLFPYFSFRNQSEQAQRDHLDLHWV